MKIPLLAIGFLLVTGATLGQAWQLNASTPATAEPGIADSHFSVLSSRDLDLKSSVIILRDDDTGCEYIVIDRERPYSGTGTSGSVFRKLPDASA